MNEKYRILFLERPSFLKLMWIKLYVKLRPVRNSFCCMEENCHNQLKIKITRLITFVILVNESLAYILLPFIVLRCQKTIYID